MRDPDLDNELSTALQPDEEDGGLKDNPQVCIYCQMARSEPGSDYCGASCAAMADGEDAVFEHFHDDWNY